MAPEPRSFDSLRRSETVKAAGLAAAMMVANVLGLVFTVIFTRLLGAGDYGSLAALLNLTAIMFVPGYSLQATTARGRGARHARHAGPSSAATLRRWTRRLLAATVLVAIVAVFLRGPIAALLNVDQDWAAAAVARRRRGCGCCCACSAACSRPRAPTAPSGSASWPRASCA